MNPHVSHLQTSVILQEQKLEDQKSDSSFILNMTDQRIGVLEQTAWSQISSLDRRIENQIGVIDSKINTVFTPISSGILGLASENSNWYANNRFVFPQNECESLSQLQKAYIRSLETKEEERNRLASSYDAMGKRFTDKLSKTEEQFEKLLASTVDNSVAAALQKATKPLTDEIFTMQTELCDLKIQLSDIKEQSDATREESSDFRGRLETAELELQRLDNIDKRVEVTEQELDEIEESFKVGCSSTGRIQDRF